VDRRATWSPALRILATQALVRRYVGGFLWVGDRNDEASGAFFSDGFSRAIARDLLFDASWLTAVDRAAELNTLLAAVAFASDPRALVMARGALVATALDVALRKGSAGERSLKTFIRERLAHAARESKDTLAYSAFVASARSSAGDVAAREMEAALHQQAEVKLPSDLAGPCFRLVPKQLVAFELGFVTSTANVMTIESVKAGSAAAAAGVRVGDVVAELHYESGRSATPVKMTVIRQEKKVLLQFLPAGRTKAGRQFERVAGLPDDRC
jgi:predicted metalloprotease with PDZ domain